MPRRRITTEKTIHAPNWDAHEAVLIHSLRERDTEAIQDELAEMTTGANANMRLSLGTTRRLTMLRGISSWTFTEEDGRPVHLCKEAILDLAPEDADYIYNAINDLNQPLSEDEKKVSSTTAAPGTSASTHEHLKLLSSEK